MSKQKACTLPKTHFSAYFAFLLASYTLVSTAASANQKIEGCFVAKTECEALHSIKKHTNPGKIQLEPFGLYSVTARNKSNTSHYQVRIPSKDPLQHAIHRWIPVSCGIYIPNCRLTPLSADSISEGSAIKATANPTKNPQYLLALSWEPSFCETHQQKKECLTLTKKRYDASHLSLHGLWPQPRNNAYCNVDSITKAIDRRKKWNLLKELKLSEATRKSLAVVMPGYASNLQRHEWIKHGTCSGLTADLYYQRSIWLTNIINKSGVGDLLAKNIGQQVSAKAIKAAFDQSFGKGVGTKVNVRCDKKGRLAELWINLSGKISQPISIEELLRNAPKAHNRCDSALIDPA